MAEIFSFRPTRAISCGHEPRVKEFGFGNGYAQITGDGLNHDLETNTLVFDRDEADSEAIIAFFKAAGGYQYFFWDSGLPGSSLLPYLCRDWKVTPIPDSEGFFRITATFRQWPGIYEIADPDGASLWTDENELIDSTPL